MNIVEIEVSKIRPYQKNTKKHPEKQIEDIAQSIQQFGFKQPIVVDKDYVIIIGHGRFEAAKRLGFTKVPCVIADDLTEEQARKLRIADNKTNESDWDLDFLKIELQELNFDEFNFDFELPEDKKEVQEDEYDFDKAAKEVPHTAQLGDIYQLGNHRLMCGDSKKEEDVKKLVNNCEMDILITDPPYNVNYTANGTREGIKNDNMTPEEFVEFLSNVFTNADSCLKAGAVFYIYFADKFVNEVTTAIKNANWNPLHLLIWKKDSLVLGGCDYQYIHEPFVYGWKEGASHSWYNDRKQVSIVEFPRPKVSKLHPTMKPLALFAYQIQNNTKEGDYVLDLFGGSGTSLIASEQINRKCFMMELDPHYVDVIINRWEKLTGKKAVKLC